MHWEDVQAAWNDLADQMQSQWPAVRAFDLALIAGDRYKFTRYLADLHDLTMAEADEAIDFWLFRVRTRRDAA
ncbi:MAG: hypothetical protein AAF566_08750 [Pseudomonadota bacterium]